MEYSIADIEKLYPNWYDPGHDLSYDDQKWIWENTPLPEEDELKLKNLTSNTSKTNVSLNGSVSDIHKDEVKTELKQSKVEVLKFLQECTYRTPPKAVALYLGIIFSKWPSKKTHWLYIAQNYTPRAINRTIRQILKRHSRGEATIQNAAAYFTHLIKFRKKRKNSTSTNGSRRQMEVVSHG